MSSTEIKDKNTAEKILDETIKSEKLGHAYLFLGPDKELMSQTAIKFAKALNCFEQGNGLSSCDRCLSCRKIEHFNHPDIGHIRAGGASQRIKIEQIRNLQKEAYLKPTEARKKVYIIYDADSMAHEASNCLLKTLEEPPRDVIIILISLHLSGLLSTIISRCQIIRFSQMPLKTSYNEAATFIDEFLNAEDPFVSDTLEFVRRPKGEQLKTVDLLLQYFRDMLVNNADKNILILMEELLKAKELLQSNVNSKLVADYILDNVCNLRTAGSE